MPIYEYHCEKCKHEFEREQRITEDPVKTCPECRSRRVKKLISQTSFVLKGGGWYNDLYSGASNKKDDSASGDGGDSKGKSGDDSKSGKSDKSDSSEKKSPKKSSKDSPKGKKSKSAA